MYYNLKWGILSLQHTELVGRNIAALSVTPPITLFDSIPILYTVYNTVYFFKFILYSLHHFDYTKINNLYRVENLHIRTRTSKQ